MWGSSGSVACLWPHETEPVCQSPVSIPQTGSLAAECARTIRTGVQCVGEFLEGVSLFNPDLGSEKNGLVWVTICLV